MKLAQLGKIFLITVTTFAIIGSSWLYPQHLYSQFQSPLPTPIATPAKGVIDLSVDKNQDGVPDELLSAIEALEAAIDAANRAGDLATNPKAQAALQHAQEEFDSKMPYSDQTRARQVKMGELNKQLLEATDQETQLKVWTEIEALQQEMLSDPNFALVAQIINRRLSDALNAKIAADIAANEKAASATPTPLPTPTNAPRNDYMKRVQSIEPMSANGGVKTSVPVVWIRILFRDACGTTNAPNFGSLTRGEIMFYAGDNKINNIFYAKKFSHIGLYDGVIGGTQRVYEANPVGDTHLGGARRESLTNGWDDPGGCVAFATVNGTTPLQRQNALDWAESTYGINGQTPYNYNFLNKNIDSALYCSQLVWKTFMHLNIDLDSNSAVYSAWMIERFSLVGAGGAAGTVAYLMVAPDEIALSPSVAIYHEGLNP